MLEVVALGGLGEFGMNMLALTWGETTIVVDAGVMFPDPELLGVDRIIPDLAYLQQKGGMTDKSHPKLIVLYQLHRTRNACHWLLVALSYQSPQLSHLVHREWPVSRPDRTQLDSKYRD